MEKILKEAFRRDADYELQYTSYDLNTWTAPRKLTLKKIDAILNFPYIRKIRITYES